MSRQGWTLIELLVVIFVISVPIVIGESVASAYGTWWGIAAGLLVGSLNVIIVILFYRWGWRRKERRLQELREKYRAIYRVVAVPSDPKIIIMPEGAEIRIGDYAWEAEPTRDDGSVYLHGLTLEWTVVWHAGLQPDQIEKVATKPNSQYDYWRPDWADPLPLPPCPFPVVERETLTMGRPYHDHSYFVHPAPYPTRQIEGKGKDGETA